MFPLVTDRDKSCTLAIAEVYHSYSVCSMSPIVQFLNLPLISVFNFNVLQEVAY